MRNTKIGNSEFERNMKKKDTIYEKQRIRIKENRNTKKNTK